LSDFANPSRSTQALQSDPVRATIIQKLFPANSKKILIIRWMTLPDLTIQAIMMKNPYGQLKASTL
jgi:hypothetical protein